MVHTKQRRVHWRTKKHNKQRRQIMFSMLLLCTVSEDDGSYTDCSYSDAEVSSIGDFLLTDDDSEEESIEHCSSSCSYEENTLSEGDSASLTIATDIDYLGMESVRQITKRSMSMLISSDSESEKERDTITAPTLPVTCLASDTESDMSTDEESSTIVEITNEMQVVHESPLQRRGNVNYDYDV